MEKYINFKEIEEEMKPIVEEAIESISDTWEGRNNGVNIVESTSRNGFISFTDGGVSGNFMLCADSLKGSGRLYDLPKDVFTSLDKLIYDSKHEVKKQFFKDNEDRLESQNINTPGALDYNRLYALGKGDIAEELDKEERQSVEDMTVLTGIECYLYWPDNSRSPIEGTHCCYVYGYINWEAPYHRLGKHKDLQWNGEEHSFEFTDIKDFMHEFKDVINKVIVELGGQPLEDSRNNSFLKDFELLNKPLLMAVQQGE